MCWVLSRQNSISFIQPYAVVTVISQALQRRKVRLGVDTTRTGRLGIHPARPTPQPVACTTTSGFSQYGMVFIWAFFFWHHLKMEFHCSYKNDVVILGYTLYFKNCRTCNSTGPGASVRESGCSRSHQVRRPLCSHPSSLRSQPPFSPEWAWCGHTDWVRPHHRDLLATETVYNVNLKVSFLKIYEFI